MATAISCTAKTVAQTETIVDRLKAAGFSSNDISVLMPSKEGTKDFAIENETKMPEGAATGAGAGALIGGGLGWLTGIGSLAIPGLGPFIAAGPIMATLAGVAAGGAVGGVAGALTGLGISEYEAKHYDEKLRSGRCLISVRCDRPGETEKAREIFEMASTEDITTSSEPVLSNRV